MIALKVRKSTYNLPTAKTRISRLPTEILLTEDDAAQIRKMIQHMSNFFYGRLDDHIIFQFE